MIVSYDFIFKSNLLTNIMEDLKYKANNPTIYQHLKNTNFSKRSYFSKYLLNKLKYDKKFKNKLCI